MIQTVKHVIDGPDFSIVSRIELVQHRRQGTNLQYHETEFIEKCICSKQSCNEWLMVRASSRAPSELIDPFWLPIISRRIKTEQFARCLGFAEMERNTEAHRQKSQHTADSDKRKGRFETLSWIIISSYPQRKMGLLQHIIEWAETESNFETHTWEAGASETLICLRRWLGAGDLRGFFLWAQGNSLQGLVELLGERTGSMLRDMLGDRSTILNNLALVVIGYTPGIPLCSLTWCK